MKFHSFEQLSGRISRTPEGFIVAVDQPIARAGDQIYAKGEIPIEPNKYGEIRVSRAPEVVFDPATIASFEGKPITIQHPEEFVNASNWKDLAVGHVQNVRRGVGADDDLLIADLLITDAEAIKLVDGGLREMSCGYDADYEELSPGRGRQTRIAGNHIALVERGRAGPEVAIRDAAPKEKTAMSKARDLLKSIFGKAVDAMPDDEVAQLAKDAPAMTPEEMSTAITALQKAVADLTALVTASADKKDEAASGAAADPKDAKIAALEKEIADMKAAADKAKDEEADPAKVGDKKPAEADAETKSRAEIIAPGVKLTGDNATVIATALKAAFADAKTGATMLALNGGRTPDSFEGDSAKQLFLSAAGIIGAQRNGATADGMKLVLDGKEVTQAPVMTADALQAKLDKHYGRA